ncbi:ethanolamine ammonia-lyase subunit EutC [Streptomyces shenzhenensis]|uniref:ethanolamine ammonia-lyase subunit EutC n=1 Tax=Streptomyces shenzhenensis TaxID=943815 RepID=UPI00381005A2
MSDLTPGASGDPWAALRRFTSARIGLGRAGDSLPTRHLLSLHTAHAVARDAVHRPLDTDALVDRIEAAGLGAPYVVGSRAADRGTYLRRPDLGRLPGDLGGLPVSGADVGVLLCDGLSPGALELHGPPLLRALREALLPQVSVAPPVLATQARVALGDHVGARLNVTTIVVVIGERPGLSVPESLGVYVTHLPRQGRTDAERNCVSNIHPPDGLAYAEAARITASLIRGARELGASGVALKDTSRERPAVPTVGAGTPIANDGSTPTEPATTTASAERPRR